MTKRFHLDGTEKLPLIFMPPTVMFASAKVLTFCTFPPPEYIIQLVQILLKKFCVTDNPKKFSLYEEYKYGGDCKLHLLNLILYAIFHCPPPPLLSLFISLPPSYLPPIPLSHSLSLPPSLSPTLHLPLPLSLLSIQVIGYLKMTTR
jgi:hypothetical protein